MFPYDILGIMIRGLVTSFTSALLRKKPLLHEDKEVNSTRRFLQKYDNFMGELDLHSF